MLTLQFIPYGEIEPLSSSKRVNHLLGLVMDERIVVLEGKLKDLEKAELIRQTMEAIDESFKGVEIEDLEIEPKHADMFKKLKHTFINLLLGDRQGLTIIGPASVVQEMKRNPESIMLFTKETRRR